MLTEMLLSSAASGSRLLSLERRREAAALSRPARRIAKNVRLRLHRRARAVAARPGPVSESTFSTPTRSTRPTRTAAPTLLAHRTQHAPSASVLLVLAAALLGRGAFLARREERTPVPAAATAEGVVVLCRRWRSVNMVLLDDPGEGREREGTHELGSCLRPLPPPTCPSPPPRRYRQAQPPPGPAAPPRGSSCA